jgi:hypothetical protein
VLAKNNRVVMGMQDRYEKELISFLNMGSKGRTDHDFDHPVNLTCFLFEKLGCESVNIFMFLNCIFRRV